MGDKFSLKWNEFQSNASKSFRTIRNEDYLNDVTLVSDDLKQVSAHKLVLSACSAYFKQIFKNSKFPNFHHQVLCLEGVSSEDLECILQYIYNGEVEIYQKDLSKFLSIAQRFKLDGLLEVQNPEEDIIGYKEDVLKETPTAQSKNKRLSVKKEQSEESLDFPIKSNDSMGSLTKSKSSSEYHDIDEKLYENMTSLGEGKYECKICSKMMPHKTKMKLHVETHMEGLSFPCDSCSQTFRSRYNLSYHKIKYHKPLSFIS